ncbi:MAG: type II toxin-antitoxin system VapC family toxin [Candidatus Gracilibacteria bacterium]|jgi:predicted nucleic acid-binding protein
MKQEKICSKYVADASVLIKWFGKEIEDLEQAQKFEEDFKKRHIEILLPAFAFWEVSSHLGRKYSVSEATHLFSAFSLYRFKQLFLTLGSNFLAFKIMKKYPKVSFYDASYHSLAMEYGAIFLTADLKYYNQAKSFGNIMLLKDYK